MKAFLLGLLLFASGAQANIIQFLYIEAGEGSASGGHVALQIGEDVYHYQYDNALIRLFKHNAEAFRVNYQLKENRTIHVADIQVIESVFDQISSHFKVKFLAQKQQLKQLQAVQQDKALLQALLFSKFGKPIARDSEAENLPQLYGAGLFYGDADLAGKNTSFSCDTSTSSPTILAGLNRQLEKQYGKAYLSRRITLLKHSLTTLSPIDKLNDHYGFSEHYADLLNGLLALQVIQIQSPLAGGACFQLKVATLSLADKAINKAKAFQQDLLQTALSLLKSNRPDWGYALFVTLARLVAIEHSIQTRQWTFLDDSDVKEAALPNQQFRLYAGLINKQRQDDLKHLEEAVSNFIDKPNGLERTYGNLEMAANRYQQWLNGERNGELRYRSEQPLPKKSLAPSQFLATGLSVTQLKSALQDKETEVENLLATEYDRNAYHLLGKNCVNALFALLDESVSGQSKEFLGGFIDPATTIVPFQAFDSVLETYCVVKSSELAAYRQQKLANLYQREIDSVVFAREANIFSSSLYKHNPDDAWFVFFTDDTVLLRPLFGAVNTLAATGQSVFGLLSWPFNGDKDIKLGARGILTSLPELAFFNIRKGSYPFPISD